jgi:hypothetical protein
LVKNTLLLTAEPIPAFALGRVLTADAAGVLPLSSRKRQRHRLAEGAVRVLRFSWNQHSRLDGVSALHAGRAVMLLGVAVR